MPDSAQYPDIELPEGWVRVSVGELADDISSGFPSGQHNQEGRGVPHLRPMNVSPHGEISLEIVKYVEENDYDALRQGDVIFNNTNSPVWVGKTAYVRHDTNWAYSNHMTRVRPKPSIVNSGWLAHALHCIFEMGYFRLHCRNHVNQASINASFLADVLLPLPPLPEQQRIIAEIEKQFTRLDAAVANLKRVQASLERYKASVLKAACEGRLVPQDPDDEPADKLLELILAERRRKWEEEEWQKQVERAQKKAAQARRKEDGLPSNIRDLESEDWENVPEEAYRTYLPKSDKWKEKYKEPITIDEVGNEGPQLPVIPDSWIWVTLDQLTWSVKDGPHYSPPYIDEGIPFITGGNVRPSGVDFQNVKYITPELHAELSKRCKPELGDVLYTKGGTTGIARVNTYEREFNVWVHVAVLKLNSSIAPFYVQHALNSPLCYEQSQRYTHGVGNQDLGLTRMIKIFMAIPPLDEQKRIVDEVERRLSVVHVINQYVSANLQRAASLRQSILQKAFSGELVPQDPADQPASSLLKHTHGEKQKGIITQPSLPFESA